MTDTEEPEVRDRRTRAELLDQIRALREQLAEDDQRHHREMLQFQAAQRAPMEEALVLDRIVKALDRLPKAPLEFNQRSAHAERRTVMRILTFAADVHGLHVQIEP